MVATIFAVLLTLLLGGIGGAAAFRFLVEKFSAKLEPQVNNVNPIEPEENVNPTEPEEVVLPLNEPKVMAPQAVRKGFQNSGTNCFMAAALQCVASIRSLLPHVTSEIGLSILSLLDKVLGGSEGTNEDLENLKKKIGLRGMGDTREAVLLLLPYLSIDYLQILFNNHWGKSMNPINIVEKNNPYLIQNENQKGCYAYSFPLSHINGDKLPFLLFNRYMLSKDFFNRPLVDIPQLIQVPIAHHEGYYDEYELVTTAQSLPGHAIAYSKEKDGWFQFDDNKVSPISDDEVEKQISKNSMLLVYCLKGPRSYT